MRTGVNKIKSAINTNNKFCAHFCSYRRSDNFCILFNKILKIKIDYVVRDKNCFDIFKREL